jgi:transposase
MARAYSNDLRHKLLSAYDKGQGSLSELAERFGVSRGWAWKISAYRTRTGSSDPPAYIHGSKSLVDEKALIGLLRAQPDATLPELAAGLEQSGVGRFSTQHLWRVVRRLGFRLKKSRSTRLNATPKPTASAVKSSSKRSVRSHLKR